MTIQKSTPRTDREIFDDALKVFDRPDEERAANVFDPEIDLDAFVERCLGFPSGLPG